MSEKKPKLKKLKSGHTKWQTTKIIIYSILTVWIIITFAMLGIIALMQPPYEQLNAMQGVYQLVTIAMIQGVIGYVIKSTIENKSKYGTAPYGGVGVAEGVFQGTSLSINEMAAGNYNDQPTTGVATYQETTYEST